MLSTLQLFTHVLLNLGTFLSEAQIANVRSVVMLVWPTDGGHYHHHEWAWQLLLAAFPEYNKLGKRLDL